MCAYRWYFIAIISYYCIISHTIYTHFSIRSHRIYMHFLLYSIEYTHTFFLYPIKYTCTFLSYPIGYTHTVLMLLFCYTLASTKLTLVQVMAWFCQATSHYLNQCCPRLLMPYGITRQQETSHYLNQCWPRLLMPYGITGPQLVNHNKASIHCNSALVHNGVITWDAFNMVSCVHTDDTL